MTETNDYDTPWKEILEGYFPQFMDFFFPAVYTAIDWSQGHEFLDKELHSISHDAEVGRRIADKLVQVVQRHGGRAWVLIHIEIQGHTEKRFAERMFIYYYRLFDRYQRPIVSMALLSDDNRQWRPDHYQQQQWGCSVDFRFLISKLIDQRHRIDQHENIFAIVVHAYLMAKATRRNMAKRAISKYQITRQLYEHGYSRQVIMDLYRFIDWMLQLPDDLDSMVWQQIKSFEEERQMAYISTAERIGMREGYKKGLEQGREIGLEQGREIGLEQGREIAALELAQRMIIKQFGTHAEPYAAQCQALSVARLEALILGSF
ncbi:MAG: DUF4351 domain-containing protein [Roseiflexaceae bacterium]